jgi:hypothetical protein
MAAIGLLSLLGILVFFVLWIVALIRKKGAKKMALGMPICFVVFVVAISLTPKSTDKLASANSSIAETSPVVATSTTAETPAPATDATTAEPSQATKSVKIQAWTPEPKKDSDANSDEVETKTTANKATINLDEFNKIQTGMTYDKVVNIIGGYGIVISESDIGDTKTIMYQWDGEGSLGANSNAMFQDGELISKAQFGLE